MTMSINFMKRLLGTDEKMHKIQVENIVNTVKIENV